jgi:HD-GYP domain-containing protein (c-di-GMP phosphodiesterase class II)
MAAPMHDVGKLSIPDAILRKPGALTPDEFEIMKGHTIVGAQLLADADTPVLRLARQIALCHHERWDGTGYPKGLAGLDIPEAARIVAIVDAYDAMTHDRVYRPALEEEVALSYMERDRGRHFDPFLFSVFLALLPEMRRIASENPDNNLVIVGEWPRVLDPPLDMEHLRGATQPDASAQPVLQGSQR